LDRRNLRQLNNFCVIVVDLCCESTPVMLQEQGQVMQIWGVS